VTAAAVAVVVVTAPSARAGVTLIEKDIDRDIERRPSNEFPDAISRADCEADATLNFPLTLADAAGSVIEVWLVEGASVDCRLGETRSGNSAVCVRIDSKAATEADNNFLEFFLESKDIAGALEGIDGCIDSQVAKARREVALFFLQVNDPNEDVPEANAAIWEETDVDLVGPPAPIDVEAVGGEESVNLSWDQTEGTDVEGYQFFCAPASEPPSTSGAGGSTASSSSATTSGAGGSGGTTAGAGGTTSGAGGAGGSTTSAGGDATGGGDSSTASGSAPIDPDCYSEVLKPGEIPTIAPSGEAGQTDSGQASGLTNGGRYACGVAAVDLLGNVGPLSELACGTPEPVDDFFELYRKYGGQAGGGFCSCGAPGAPRQGGVLALSGAAVAAALWMRRRRRSNRDHAAEGRGGADR
jgi:MYXO-CTERM domain-containing protein